MFRRVGRAETKIASSEGVLHTNSFYIVVLSMVSRSPTSGDLWHFGPRGAGFGRRSLSAIFQFPFRRAADRFKATRGVDWINNFWKAIANHPATLKRMWEDVKQVMAPGALDPLTYIAVSITNNCPYCIASHTASARGKGMTDEQFAELLAR